MACTKAKIAVGTGIAALVAIQSYEIASQNKELTLQQQASAQSAKLAAESDQKYSQEIEQLRADKINLSNELFKFHEQLTSTKPRETSPPQPEVKLNQNAVQENSGRQLGLAVAQGDPTALAKLVEMAKAERQFFNTNQGGMNDSERGDLNRQTFAPLRAAFAAITEEATKGNQAALQAISTAVQIPELQGPAIKAAGVLAGNGDEVALQILLNPKDYNVLLSSTVSALKPAADNGNQKAIDALAAVAANPKQRVLWYMVADGLENSAASGNSAAIDALIAISGDTNQSVRGKAISGLERAGANQNEKAAEALRQMRVH